MVVYGIDKQTSYYSIFFKRYSTGRNGYIFNTDETEYKISHGRPAHCQ